METLVSSLDEIKSTELVILRIACCGKELITLCDPSDRTNHKVYCNLCGKDFETDMKPVITFGNVEYTNLPNDLDILKEVKKANNKLTVI